MNNKRRNRTFYIPGSVKPDSGITDADGKTYVVMTDGSLRRKSLRRHE